MSNAGGAVTDLSIKLYQSVKEGRNDHPYDHWHASSISQCPRAHYFLRLGVEPTGMTEPSGAKILRWEAGHHMEHAIREHVRKQYPDLVSNERFTSTALDLTGELDNYTPKAKRIVEIKTVHDYAFIERDGEVYLKEHDGHSENGRNKWKPKLEPYLHHELQEHSYYLLLKEVGMEVDEIEYVYLSLSGRIVTYRTPVRKDRLANVKKRLEVLNQAWKTQTPPDCICGDTDHPLYGPVMQYCDFKQEDTCCSLSLIKE